ncbi:ATP-dependent DNA ligase, partial [Clostridium botulinum D/C]
MKKIYEIVTQIASTSSRNEKETILNNNKENELLSNIFQFIFNPYIVTGISSKKYNKFKDINSNSSITNIKEMMEYLKVNNTGRDMDIKSIIGFINDQDEQLRDVLKQIATKSLKIGVTAKTLNKVYGKGFIPEFNVMLADKYFTNQNRINGEFIVTTKLDGGRAVIIKENGNVKFFTRQG